MCAEAVAEADASDGTDARDLRRVLTGAAEFVGDGELVWQLGYGSGETGASV
jgi:hypothetical protein